MEEVKGPSFESGGRQNAPLPSRNRVNVRSLTLGNGRREGAGGCPSGAVQWHNDLKYKVPDQLDPLGKASSR